MFFRPFYRFDTGCAAYVFGCGGNGLACVVDPYEADVDEYARFAASKGMKITHVFDTHVHADHRGNTVIKVVHSRGTRLKASAYS